MKYVIMTLIILLQHIYGFAQHDTVNLTSPGYGSYLTPANDHLMTYFLLHEKKNGQTIFSSTTTSWNPKLYNDLYNQLLNQEKKKQLAPLLLTDSRFMISLLPEPYSTQNYKWVARKNEKWNAATDLIGIIIKSKLESKYHVNLNSMGYYSPVGSKY